MPSHTEKDQHLNIKTMTVYHTRGNPAIPGKSNKSCLAADREIGRLKGGGVNMRTGLTTECRGGPGCKSPRGRSIGRRPACPRSRPTLRAPPPPASPPARHSHPVIGRNTTSTRPRPANPDFSTREHPIWR